MSWNRAKVQLKRVRAKKRQKNFTLVCFQSKILKEKKFKITLVSLSFVFNTLKTDSYIPHRREKDDDRREDERRRRNRPDENRRQNLILRMHGFQERRTDETNRRIGVCERERPFENFHV
jgi:hypothetical protein